jgi:hypothetical protein
MAQWFAAASWSTGIGIVEADAAGVRQPAAACVHPQLRKSLAELLHEALAR